MNLARSQRPSTSERSARGTLRKRASASASVCSAAATEFDSGALATMIPRRVAAGMSTLSTPVPARPITLRLVASSISSGVIFVAERIRIASYSPIRSRSSSSDISRPELDLEVVAEQVDAVVGDLLLDQDLHPATPSTFSSTQSMQTVERLDVVGLDRREHPDPQLVAAELAVGLDVDDPVGAQGGGQSGGVDRVGEVDRADDQRAFGGVGDERRGDVAALGPAVEVAGGLGGPPHAPLEAAVAEHPLDLVSEQEQGRQGGRVVGLLLARVVQGGLQREEFRLPATLGAIELLDPGDRGRAQQRQPEAAVGAEGLLRGEVIGVRLGDVDRQAAGARGGVDQNQGVAGASWPLDRDHDAGRGLVVGPGEHVGGGVGRRGRRVARLCLDQDRIGQERRRRGRPGELLRELAVGEVEGALAHEPGGGGVPEGGRAAVAERHLVAAGQREEVGEAAPHPGDQVAHRRLAVGSADQVRALGQRRQRLWAHLRGAAAETAVGGLQLGGNLNRVGGLRCHRARQVIDRRGWTGAGAGGRLAALLWLSRPT